MPNNNARTSRNIRRAKALARFSVKPERSTDVEYQKRKAQEHEALSRPL